MQNASVVVTNRGRPSLESGRSWIVTVRQKGRLGRGLIRSTSSGFVKIELIRCEDSLSHLRSSTSRLTQTDITMESTVLALLSHKVSNFTSDHISRKEPGDMQNLPRWAGKGVQLHQQQLHKTNNLILQTPRLRLEVHNNAASKNKFDHGRSESWDIRAAFNNRVCVLYRCAPRVKIFCAASILLR